MVYFSLVGRFSKDEHEKVYTSWMLCQPAKANIILQLRLLTIMHSLLFPALAIMVSAALFPFSYNGGPGDNPGHKLACRKHPMMAFCKGPGKMKWLRGLKMTRA